ncbi:hypothetical protein Pla110_42110 [Polystyrenella longa]|uniref:Uncharacterized protein n=1 Tax=Polystyrenella longa TaxID=2528007 RepID=A0A518CTE8_9PLAN|nr:hypothetical protein Pla110_42110 [Polystyrenella longa]
MHKTIFHFVDRVEHVESTMVMCHNNNPRSLFVCDFREQLHHLSTSLTVKSCRWFIGKNDAGSISNCSSDGDALLLTAYRKETQPNAKHSNLRHL